MKKIAAYLYFLYALTTIFLPKFSIRFELSGIYLFEPICIFISFLVLLSGRLKFTLLEKSYLLYIGLCFFSWLLTGGRDIKSILLLVKFASFILLVPIGRYFINFFTESRLKTIINSQLLFVFIAGGYVVYNTLFHPVSLEFLSGGYSSDYRLIGFTGKVFKSGELIEIGHTSVAMGVYIAILCLINFALYLYLRKRGYLAVAVFLFIGEMFTYSRAGFLVIIIGLSYFFVSKLLKKGVVKFLFIFVFVILIISIFTNLWNYLSAFGIVGKLVQSGVRSLRREEIWTIGLNYIWENPLTLLYGIGYGNLFSILGFGTTESLFFDTLLQAGIPALFLILAFFYYLWKYSRNLSGPFGQGNYFKAVLYGYSLAIPGLFVACSIGGNSIQTDFIAPVFYLVLGICLVRIRIERNQARAADETNSAKR
jgi:O-antigen ligase